VDALLKKLRKADAAPAPQQTDEEILDSIKSLSDDAEEVSAFLRNLIEIDADRAESYLRHIKANFSDLFAAMKSAAEELFAQEEEDEAIEEEEVPVEEEEVLEEEGGYPAMTHLKRNSEDEDEMDLENPEESVQQEEVEFINEEGEDEGGEMEEEIVEEEEPVEEGMGAEPPTFDAPMEDALGEEMEVEEEPPKEEIEELDEMEEEGQEDEEVAVEPVVDPEELARCEGAALDMLLFGEATDNPHWSIFADGKPLAEIQLQDQENPEEIKEVFTSDEYPKHVQEACSTSMGVIGTLKALNARWYAGVTSTGYVAEEARTAAATDLEGEFATRLAHLKEDLLNTINLAITASNKGSKGLFIENTLKGTLAEAFRNAGVPNARQIVNEVWVEAAQEYMGGVLKTAEKWMGYSPEAMNEVTKEILGSAVEPNDEEETAEPTVEETQATQASKTGIVNVPVRTAHVQPHAPEADYRTTTKTRVASTLSRRMGRQRTAS
jgi:hypothetical protein